MMSAPSLIAMLKETIDFDRFPPSPRIRSLKRILAKLRPPAAAPLPAPKPPGERGMVLVKKGR